MMTKATHTIPYMQSEIIPKSFRLPLGAMPITLALLLLCIQSCAGPATLRKDGLSYLKVGDPMPEDSLKKLEGLPVNGTLVSEEGYSWRALTVDYKEGPVVVESDFGQRTVVSRIRVETPELRLKDGLRVGQSLDDLRAKTDRWIAKPFPKYELIEMVSTKYPRRVFLLQVDDFDYQEGKATVPPEELPGTAKVVGIVIM